ASRGSSKDTKAKPGPDPEPLMEISAMRPYLLKRSSSSVLRTSCGRLPTAEWCPGVSRKKDDDGGDGGDGGGDDGDEQESVSQKHSVHARIRASRHSRSSSLSVRFCTHRKRAKQARWRNEMIKNRIGG